MLFLFIIYSDFPECLTIAFCSFFFVPPVLMSLGDLIINIIKTVLGKDTKYCTKSRKTESWRISFRRYFFSLLSRWSYFISPDYSLEQQEVAAIGIWVSFIILLKQFDSSSVFPQCSCCKLYMFHAPRLIKNSFLPFKQCNFLRWEDDFFDWWSFIKLGVAMVCLFWSWM